MAHSLSARKRVRQNSNRRALNRWRLRHMRAAIKDFNDTIAHGSKADATEAFKKCIKSIDRSAQRGVIHRNQAARRKSRLNARLKSKA